MKNYSKFITFLKGLEAGFEIELEDRTYALGYDEKGNPKIVHKLLSINDKGEESFVYMQGFDLPDFNWFIINVIDQLTDEQETLINSNIVLNKTKDEKNDTQ